MSTYTLPFPAAKLKINTNGTVKHIFNGGRTVEVKPDSFKIRKHAKRLGIPNEAYRVVHEFLLHAVAVAYGFNKSLLRSEAGATDHTSVEEYEQEQRRAWALAYYAFGKEWEDEETLEQMRADGVPVDALAQKVLGLVCLVAAE